MLAIPQSPFSETFETRARIVDMVRKWGGFTTDAVLDPAMCQFSEEGISGFISYRFLENGCLVVFGDPICAEENKTALSQAFHRFAKQQNREVIYIGTSRSFAHWAIHNVCKTLIEFGEELTLDPTCDPRKNTGPYGSLVRRKVKQAAREGVVIHEYVGENPSLERSIEEVGVLWLKKRRGPQLHISNIHLFDDRAGKRWFYAQKGHSIVGVIILNQLQAQGGWLINHLMITSDAPNGTSELLMVTALETLAKEGCRFATVGVVASQQLGEIIGLSPLATWAYRMAFNIVRRVVRLDGLNTFWGKFQPQSRPSYLLFSRNRIGLLEIHSLKCTLQGSV